ncbi:MAG: hypothetical protein LBK99_27495 [Opitutaceae bacterium]|jgi:hypothetical protein|nr:hypothetical protein [Opitutaceae bacterium]
MIETLLETALVAYLKTSPALADVPIYRGHTGQKMDTGETSITVTVTGLTGPLAYAGYPEASVQILVRTKNSDGAPHPAGDEKQARYVTAVRGHLGVNSTSGPGPAALAVINTQPGLGCTSYCTDGPTAEARDEEKRIHGLATPWRFWIHRR